MKKIYSIIVTLLLSLFCGYAQEMSVQSFVLAETDLTANTSGTMKHDQNGEVAALIKVETTQKGFTFDVGMLGVIDVVEHPAEIWVYVPFGIRKMTIQHPQLGILRDYQFPCAIEKGRTYIMKLTAGNVRTIVEHAPAKQFLLVQLTPADAILEINGRVKVVDNGVYQELLPFGSYHYKAYCQGYHDIAGVVEVADFENAHKLDLKLKAAFGHISVLADSQPDLSGAAVYVDDKFVGQIPLNHYQMDSGSHMIRILKEMYEPYNESFVISDEQMLEIDPVLVPDFAEVTLVSDEGVEIYVNGETMGVQKWTGKLSSGSYIFETRKKGHIPYKVSYDISRDDNARIINVQAPTPMFGSLAVSSKPSGARIYLDGKYLGETPKFIPRQVVGEYEVRVELNGYQTMREHISVKEGQESSVSFPMLKNTLEKSTVSAGGNDDAYPFQVIDEQPTFLGGNANQFSKWVSQRLVYPKVAIENGVEGRVSLRFIIEKDGSLTNIQVVRSVDPALDKEAVRVVSMSPKWKPGEVNGNPVRVSLTFPVIFNLN